MSQDSAPQTPEQRRLITEARIRRLGLPGVFSTVTVPDPHSENSEAPTTTLSPLKAILLIGKNIYIPTKLRDLYNKSGYLMIGDGTRLLTQEEIAQAVKENGGVDKNTRIDINAHGNVLADGSHKIVLIEGINSTTNTLSLISKLALDIPLKVHLWSCFGGSAPESAAKALPNGSIVIAHAPRDAESSGYTMLIQSATNFQHNDDKHKSETLSEISDHLLTTGAQSLTFAIKLNNGNTESFTFAPPMELLADGSIMQYFRDCFNGVHKRLTELNDAGQLPSNLLPLPAQAPSFTGEQIKNYLQNSFVRHLLSYPKDTAYVRSAIKAGIDINVPGSEGILPISSIVSDNNIEMVKTLAGLGANLEATSQSGYTELMSAASAGKVEMVETLAGLGANLEATDHGYTALMSAVLRGDVKILEALIRSGANVNNKAFDLALSMPQERTIASFIINAPDDQKIIFATKLLDSNLSNKEKILVDCITSGKLESMQAAAVLSACKPDALSKDSKDSIALYLNTADDKGITNFQKIIETGKEDLIANVSKFVDDKSIAVASVIALSTIEYATPKIEEIAQPQAAAPSTPEIASKETVESVKAISVKSTKSTSKRKKRHDRRSQSQSTHAQSEFAIDFLKAEADQKARRAVEQERIQQKNATKRSKSQQEQARQKDHHTKVEQREATIRAQITGASVSSATSVHSGTTPALSGLVRERGS